jgi:hypothetical protein
MRLGEYNPFPHVIAASVIEHAEDCPACQHARDMYEFTKRILDRLEEAEEK